MRDPPVRTSEFRPKMVKDALELFCRTRCPVCILFTTTQYHQVVIRLHTTVGTYCSRHDEFGNTYWRINVIGIYDITLNIMVKEFGLITLDFEI